MTKKELKQLSALMIDHELKDNQALANAIGVSRQYVSALINGIHPHWKLRQQIADHFNVPYNAIWESKRKAA
jgi:DNA-binding XRE family transcriptional regulator